MDINDHININTYSGWQSLKNNTSHGSIKSHNNDVTI